MEQAISTFNKGLLIDTNPMITGIDVMSDCLNGTLITMSGNEIILQNDMGNRRVNNAFLPPGYLPVGMKEYGGVIYIAAYNPITNKSQIGSFPSPLRRINNEINKDLLGNTFRFGEVLLESNTYNYTLKNIEAEVKFLNNDVFLVPLTSDIVLHAGDKFVVNADRLSENWDCITNYRNTHNLIDGVTNTTKAISPKNRMFTLSLGILNSLNEFVDITKTLCRWENKGGKWSTKKYNSSYSDIFKFNDEYFIPDTFNNDSLDETIEDARLIRVRLTIEANTYAYKLIGPLYLKVALNHIETFSFNIYGKINEEAEEVEVDPGLEGELTEGTRGSASLLIEALITYNCPDGINSSLPETNPSILNGNLDYETFDEGTPDFNEFRIFDFIGSNGEIITPTKITYKKSIYNPNNNLYTLRIIKEYSISYTDNLYNYFIGVIADKSTQEDPVYLKGLSNEGTIDLNLLGSGQVSGDIWKFHNTVKTDSGGEVTGIDIKILFGLSAYPDNGHVYRNLRFRFENINNANDVYYGPVNTNIDSNIDPSSPNFQSLIDGLIGISSVIRGDYNRSNFRSTSGEFIKARESYKVFVYCDDYDSENDTSLIILLLNDLELWYLSTGLFNEFFGDDNIKNFCTVNTSNPSNKRFADKMIVRLESLVSSDSSELESSKELDGSMVSTESNLSFKSINTESVTLKYNSNIKIKDEELYPTAVKKADGVTDSLLLNLSDTEVRFENIKLNFSYDDTSLNTQYIRSIEKSDSNPYTIVGGYEGDFNNEDLFSISISNSLPEEISITVNHNDLLLGTASIRILTAMAFDNFFDYVLDNFERLICYHGIVPNYDEAAKSEKYIIDAPYKKRDKGDFVETLPKNNMYFDNGLFTPYNENYYQASEDNPPRVKHGSLYNTNGCVYYTGPGANGGRNTIEYIMNDLSTIRNILDRKSVENKIFCYLFSHYASDTTSINYHLKDDYLYDHGEKGYEYTRVWWKNSDNNEWILFKNLLKKNDTDVENVEIGSRAGNFSLSMDNYSVSALEFTNFLRGEMKDYVYCIDTLYNFGALSSPAFYSILGANSSYKYINEHNINMFVIFKFGISNDNIIELGQTYGNLIFKFDKDNGSIEEYKIKLKSNNNFYQTIKDLENIDESELPIYIKTGKVYDKFGYLLNYLKVYYLENGELNLIQNEVDRKMLNGNPVLLCNSTHSVTHSLGENCYRYDVIGGTEDAPRITIDYEGFPVVNNV